MLLALEEIWGPAINPGTVAPSGVDIKAEFFDKYYDRTYTLDLPLLQTLLHTAWHEFATYYSTIVVTDPGTVRCPTPSFRLDGSRHSVSIDYVEGLSNMFWFGIYIRIRCSESGVLYKNIPHLTREAVNVANAYGYDRGLQYINNLFKPYLYDERMFKKYLTRSQESVIVGSVLDAPTVHVGSSTSAY